MLSGREGSGAIGQRAPHQDARRGARHARFARARNLRAPVLLVAGVVALLAVASVASPRAASGSTRPVAGTPAAELADTYRRCAELQPPPGWTFVDGNPGPGQIRPLYENGNWKNIGEDPGQGYGDILCEFTVGVAGKNTNSVRLQISVDHGCTMQETWGSPSTLEYFRLWSMAGIDYGQVPPFVRNGDRAAAQVIEPGTGVDATGNPYPQNQHNWLVALAGPTSIASLYTENTWAPANDPSYQPVLPDTFITLAQQLATSTDPWREGVLGTCPNAPQPSATSSGLGVQLMCESNNPDPGLVICTATPTGARPDAVLAYEWTYDGAGQGETGTELRLTGVTPEHHGVTVVAHDVGTDELSSPASVEFDKVAYQATEEPPASSGEGGSTQVGPDGSGGDLNPFGEGTSPGGGPDVPGGSGGPPPILVLVGGVILVSIGGVVVARVIGRSTVPVAPQPVPPGAVPIGPAGPPRGGSAGAPVPPSAGWSGPPPPIPLPGDLTSVVGAVPPPDLLVLPQARPGDEGSTGSAEPPGTQEPGPPEPAPVTPPVLIPPPPHPTEGPPSTEQYRFEVVTPAVTVPGSGKHSKEVRVRIVSVATGVEVPDAVVVQIARSDERVEFLQGGPKVTLRVWSRYIGPRPITATLTFTGISKGGVPVAPATVAVTVEPAAIQVHIIAWKKGFKHQEVTMSLQRACAFVRGGVVANRHEIDEPKPGKAPTPVARPGTAAAEDLVPVADALCQYRLRIVVEPELGAVRGGASETGDGEWTDPINERTDRGGHFQLMFPPAWTAKFGGAGVTESLPRPVEVHLHRDVKRHLAAFRGEISRLPLAAPYMAPRQDCGRYPETFFTQLCRLDDAAYDGTIGGLELLRASAVFVTRYRKDFLDQRVLARRAFKEALGSFATLLVFTSGLAGKMHDWVGSQLTPLARSAGELADRLPSFKWLIRITTAPISLALSAAQRLLVWSLVRFGAVGRRLGIIQLGETELREGLATAAKKAEWLMSESSGGLAPGGSSGSGNGSFLFSIFGAVVTLFEILRYAIAQLLLRGVGGMIRLGCEVLADALPAVRLALQMSSVPEATYKRLWFKELEQYLRDTGKAFDRKVSEWATVVGVTGTGPSVMQDAGEALLSVGPTIDEMDATAAKALATAVERSRTRDTAPDWSASIHRAVKAQTSFLAGWSKAESVAWYLEAIDNYGLAAAKVLVQGACWIWAVHLHATLEAAALLARTLAARSKAAYALSVGAELQSKAADFPSRVIDVASAMVYVTIAVKEFGYLVLTARGLPEMIDLLYYGPARERDVGPEPAVVKARVDPKEIAAELARSGDEPVTD